MTTTVIVEANHGWPVKVSRLDESGVAFERIVPAGAKEHFAVWDGADLQIHEIQPREPEFTRAAAPKIGGV